MRIKVTTIYDFDPKMFLPKAKTPEEIIQMLKDYEADGMSITDVLDQSEDAEYEEI